MCVGSLIKLGGAGAVRAERGWSATSEVERWEGEDLEQTGEASAGSGLQNVGLGSWRPRKTEQTARVLTALTSGRIVTAASPRKTVWLSSRVPYTTFPTGCASHRCLGLGKKLASPKVRAYSGAWEGFPRHPGAFGEG